jgi:hypothetical protein
MDNRNRAIIEVKFSHRCYMEVIAHKQGSSNEQMAENTPGQLARLPFSTKD